MIDSDSRRLLEVVAEAVRVARLPVRELETALGINHGSLSAMLRGRLELRVRHLVALAKVLRVPPGDFLELGCPDATASARFRLASLSEPLGLGAAAATPLPKTVEELGALIRASVREELAKRDMNQKS